MPYALANASAYSCDLAAPAYRVTGRPCAASPQIVRASDPAILPAPRIPMFMLLPPLWFVSIVAFSADSVNARGKRIQQKYAITVRKKAQPYGYASVMSPAGFEPTTF